MTGQTTPRISVDQDACAGHGRCYAVAPELFEPDEEGFSVVVGEAGDEQRRANLDMAARNCPEGAILVSANE